MSLDLRTILVSNFYIFAICALIMAILAWQSRGRIRGAGFWVADFSCQTLALFLIALRGIIPDGLSMIGGNALAVGGAILGYFGFADFLGRRRRILPNLALFIAFTAVHAWFTFIHPDLAARSGNVSVALAIACGESALILLLARGRRYVLLAALSSAGYSLLGLFRIAYYLRVPLPSQDYLHSSQMETLFQILYQILMILLTCSIALMVSGYLVDRLRAEREKFSKAFQASPVAICLTRQADGTVLEVNEAFQRISGFSAEEAIGKSTLELEIWRDPAERASLVEELARTGRVVPREASLGVKSGGRITGILGAERIRVDGEWLMISSFSDITERKRMEDEVRALLAEKELLLKEVHHRVRNNLNTVNALLAYEGTAPDTPPRAAAVLEEAAERVRSMSLLYDRLYGLERYDSLSLEDFLGPLAREVMASFPRGGEVELEVRLDQRRIPAAVLAPLGLIVNELLTNAMKYAFPAGRKGRIRLAAGGAGPRMRLEVGDDGIGARAAAAGRPREDGGAGTCPGGFGLELVSILAGQLGGRLSVEEAGGMRYAIEFDLPETGS